MFAMFALEIHYLDRYCKESISDEIVGPSPFDDMKVPSLQTKVQAPQHPLP
jgi:hypothetical protein